MSAGSHQRHQELAYPADHDYRGESPHLKHERIYRALLDRVKQCVDDLHLRGLPPTVLDVGAGDGSFVEPLLAYGCSVTAAEMSRPAIDTLQERYGRNAQFESVFDPDGSLAVLGNRRFSFVLFASVLHHIPDYEAALREVSDRHLAPGGVLVALQDPLWYPRLPRGVHALSEIAFLTWRLRQGNLLRGVASRVRRARDRYEEDHPSDVVEYHVVRDGVDEDAVHAALAPSFAQVEILRYWSTFDAWWQRAGDRLGMANTFAVVAIDRSARD